MNDYINLGQYIPAQSFLHQLDPRTKIILLAVLAGALFLVTSLLKLLLLVSTVFILLVLSGMKADIYISSLRPFVIIMVIIFIVQAWLTPGILLWQWGPFKVSTAGLYAAGNIIVRLMALILLARMLTATCSTMSLTDGLGRLLKPLHRIGFPVQELIMIMILSIRFIPIFSEAAHHIRNAQQCRGIDWKHGRFGERIINMLALLVPLFRIAISRANDLVEAMESRAFQSGAVRTSLSQWSMAGGDYFTLAALILIIVVLILMP